jgi:hypothetical protein
MTPSYAFEEFLVIRSYPHMRKPERKAIMAISFFCGLTPSGDGGVEGNEVYNPPTTEGLLYQRGSYV